MTIFGTIDSIRKVKTLPHLTQTTTLEIKNYSLQHT